MIGAAAGRERRFLAPLLVVLAVACVFGRALGGAFLAWDDYPAIAQNPLYDPPTLASLGRIWSAPHEHLYVPLSWSAWWLLAALSRAACGRLEPAFFHAANLVLHAATALLVLRWLEELLEERGAALLGALFFALHPLQVESVAWSSELRGLLSSLCGFGALLAVLRGQRLAGLGLFGLALLAKPAAAGFALLLPLQELYWRRRPPREVLRDAAAWLALALLAVLWTRAAQPAQEMGELCARADRPRIALDALGFYLAKLALPLGLCAEYGRSPARVLAEEALWPALLACVLALCAVLLVPQRRRGASALAGFVALLLPVLGLLPFGYQQKSTVADRYVYAALAPAALLLGLLLQRFGRPARLAAALALCAFAALSFAQAAHWRDTRALFEQVLRVNPRSVSAHEDLGLAAIEARDFETACQHYLRALELEPLAPLALENLGLAECELGRLEPGLDHLRQAIAVAPRRLQPRQNLVAALGRAGRFEEAEAAARELAAVDAQDPAALLPLARVLRVRGKRAQAQELLARVLALRPGWNEALAEQRALEGR